MMKFSSRFDQALMVAALAHRSQVRKGTCIPYLMHPFHVAVLLERHGFPEPVVIAGLLHDVLEDTDFESDTVRTSFATTIPAFREHVGNAEHFRAAMIAFIRVEFGEDVLAMVEVVTEKKEDKGPKRPWRTRKDEQLAHLATISPGAAAVKAADAVHNARSILRDLQSLGSAAFRRFNCSPLETLWYYGTLADSLRDHLGDQHPLALELDEAVFDMTETAHRLLESAPPLSRCAFCGATEHSEQCCAESNSSELRIENAVGRRIYSLAHWRRLAPPVGKDVQWVNRRSAKESARAWSGLRPAEQIVGLLRRGHGLHDFHAATAIAELVTALDTFGEGRNHDLVVLGTAEGKRILVGVESKSDEELGPYIGDYLERVGRENQERSAAGKRLSRVPERIENLTRLVFGDRAPEISALRYQLLHGLAGTLIEAVHRKADAAVFIVHQFTSDQTISAKVARNEADILKFADAIAPGASALLREGRLAGPYPAGGNGVVPAGFPFYIGVAHTELSAGRMTTDHEYQTADEYP